MASAAPSPPRVDPSARGGIAVRHLGWSGLAVTIDGATLSIDPPDAVPGPLVLTWTEQERTSGARVSPGPVAAAPIVLEWLGIAGLPLGAETADLAGFSVAARPFAPIPYATAPEALRKTLSALRKPLRAARRLVFLAGRPDTPPLVLRIDRGTRRVVLLQQALHRFVDTPTLDALVAWAGPADLVVAGTDYDDEPATGRLLAHFDAPTRVIADLTGSIRRALDLPVRPLGVALDAAPPGTLPLVAGETLEVPVRPVADASRAG